MIGEDTFCQILYLHYCYDKICPNRTYVILIDLLVWIIYIANLEQLSPD